MNCKHRFENCKIISSKNIRGDKNHTEDYEERRCSDCDVREIKKIIAPKYN